MPYRAPNTYARFIKTASAVTSAGNSRIMGLIGTGLNYYEVYNETVKKSSDKPFDTLENNNVFEIINVSTKPMVTGKTITGTVYTQGTNFTLEDGKNIVWSLINGNEPKLNVVSSNSALFKTKVENSLVPMSGKEYLVEDGKWLIEISYVDDTTRGTYRVINYTTSEIIGEYVAGADVFNVIPGYKLNISTTKLSADSAVGDYVLISTTAGKTEVEPSVTFDTNSKYNHILYSDMITTVVNTDNLENKAYIITVTDTTTNQFTVTEEGNSVAFYTGIMDVSKEYLEVIPGISFAFSAIPATLVDGDVVRVIVTPRTTNQAPAEGTVYYVSYKYRKSEENYEPKIFVDYDDIITEYGQYDVTASGIVINSLALGAQIAFENGVSSIICVQAKNDSDYEMKIAMDKLKKTLPGANNVNTIVPLTDSPSIGAYAMEHVDLMSSMENAKERMVYLGAQRKQLVTKNASILDKSIGMIETAKAYNNERVVFVVPGEITKSIRDLTTGSYNNRKLSACYAAVAVAALGLKNDPAEPLTNKTISGFVGLTETFMESEKNMLAEAGCLVLDQRGSAIKVRHGITTSTAGVNSQEITLVQIKDYVIDACRTSTASTYIGNKNKPSIVSDVQFTIDSILKQFISQEIILGVNGLTIKRNSDNPTQIDVNFEIEAVYPLNYIMISFGFSSVS